MTATVRLCGGRFDGLVSDVHPDVLEVGFLPVPECPRHGAHSYCGCDDELWFGYFAEPGKGAGQFVPEEDTP